MIVIAHDIRSLHNVGSIFRNCASFGIDKLYLTGYTAIPPRKEISKVALGSENLVKWEHQEVFKLIKDLKEKGYKIFGLETGSGSIPLDKFIDETRSIFKISTNKGVKIEKKLVLILGNEVEGIDDEILDRLDGIVEIPMSKKRSLNVSVASGVAMYVLTR